jgi:DNA end-binding protein Ku
MFFQNEVRKLEEIGPVETTEIKDKELQLANSLIESLAGDFDPGKYHDQFATQLRGMIEAKIQGQPLVEVEKPRMAPVIDLMAALKQSLEQMKKVPGKAVKVQEQEEQEVRQAPGPVEVPAPAQTAARPRKVAARSKK